jgi:hypothetical protein
MTSANVTNTPAKMPCGEDRRIVQNRLYTPDHTPACSPPLVDRFPVVKASAAKPNASILKYIYLKRSAPYLRPRLRFR